MSRARTTKCYIIIVSLVLVFVVILSTEARADLYTFDVWEPITNNSDYEDEFAQGLSLQVTNEGLVSGDVLFKFFNNSTIDPTPVWDPVLLEFVDTVGPGAITDIYFDDGALLGISYIINDTGVSFGYPADPGNLPGHNNVSPPFETSSVESGQDEAPHFSADSTNAPLGVDPGEYVGIEFDIGNNAFADVIDAINLGFTQPSNINDPDDPWYTNSLRIGVHVSNLGLDNNSDDEPGDYSDSFIMTPIPSAVLLGMLGLGVAGLKLRKFA